MTTWYRSTSVTSFTSAASSDIEAMTHHITPQTTAASCDEMILDIRKVSIDETACFDTYVAVSPLQNISDIEQETPAEEYPILEDTAYSYCLAVPKGASDTAPARRLLAEGAGGWIYAARSNQAPSSKVVLKKLKIELSSCHIEGQAPSTQHLYDTLSLREFKIMQKCNANSNILSVLSLLKDHTPEETEEQTAIPYRWCLVLPLADGGCLKTLLGDVRSRKLAFPLDFKDLIFKKLVKAVTFLHSHNLVHRDIKPENVLIDGNGELKLTDFGYALDLGEGGSVSDLAPAKINLGTVSYKSPELFNPRYSGAVAKDSDVFRKFDFRAVDVWALGLSYLVIHFMMKPWDEASAEDLYYKAYASLYKSEEVAKQYKKLVMNNAFEKSAAFKADKRKSFEIFCRIKSMDTKEVVIRMLDPIPSTRFTIKDVSRSKWLTQCVDDNKGLSDWVKKAARG